MKMIIAAAVAMFAMSANAATVATFARDGKVYKVDSVAGVYEDCLSYGEGGCPNQGGKVPQWLADLNEWFAQHGFETSAPVCSDAYVCPNEGGKVPAWLEKLNQWFMDHGFSAPTQDSPYVG